MVIHQHQHVSSQAANTAAMDYMLVTSAELAKCLAVFSLDRPCLFGLLTSNLSTVWGILGVEQPLFDHFMMMCCFSYGVCGKTCLHYILVCLKLCFL